MKNIAKISGAIVGGIILIGVVALLLAYPIKWIWNGCLVGAVDGIHPITALQALGISVLCGILFKSHSISKTISKSE
jgi:hypothetical protein